MNVIAPRCWHGDDHDASEIDLGFLQKIIPDDGVMQITKIGDKTSNIACSDLTDMVDQLERLDKTSANVYHACASFHDDTSRRADNVMSLKALYLDLDCGEDKASSGGGYRTKVDAVEALRAFCQECKLPRPLIVDSGGGIHAYWPFEVPVSVEEWRPVAVSLKALCSACGLKADPSVTADAARILRPVGTHNKKYVPPRRVSLLCDKGPWEFASLRHAIEVAAGGCFLTPFKVREGNGKSARIHKEMQENAKLLSTLSPETWDESQENIAKVNDMLGHIPPDCEMAEWRCLGWSIASLNWECGQKIFTRWSQGSPKHWKDADDGGDKAEAAIKNLFSRFDPDKGITVGTLIHHARHNGCPDIGDAIADDAGDAPENVPNWVANMNRKYAYVEAQKNIYRFEFDDFAKPVELKTEYQNAKLEIPGNGKVERVCRVTSWLCDSKRRQHRGLVFSPGEGPITRQNDINTWTGFAVPPEEGDIGPYLALRDHLIPDPEERRYVEQWLAHKLRNPGTKLNTALVVWGVKNGVGKNLLFETCGEIVGDKHYCVVTKNDLTGDFNSWAKNKLFVIGDEVLSSGNRHEANKFKTLITGTKLRINEKNQPEYYIDNHIGFVFLSNHEDAIHMAIEDRRYYVVEVAGDAKPKEFYDEYAQWRDSGGLAALHHYLANEVTLTDFNPMAPAPMTNAKREMIAAGRSSLEQWMVDTLQEPTTTLGGEVISIKALSSVYQFRSGDKRSTSKAVEKAAKKAGARRRVSQIRNEKGEKVRVWSLADHDAWEGRSETEWRNELATVENYILTSLPHCLS